MSYYAVTYSRSLSHHGIKGQKWGVRRFRNKDGSLTPEGKARYSDNELKLKQKETIENRIISKNKKDFKKLASEWNSIVSANFLI